MQQIEGAVSLLVTWLGLTWQSLMHPETPFSFLSSDPSILMETPIELPKSNSELVSDAPSSSS